MLVSLLLAPHLFDQPTYQSPVRAGGDDLLLLPGLNLAATDTVVYQALVDTRALPAPPENTPTSSSAASGVGEIASAADAPHALAIRLPAALDPDQSYALWLRNADGEWSNGVRINDARPIWITPDFTYTTRPVADLPRMLKVVGRNLQPARGHATLVRLSGPCVYTLIARVQSSALQRYVAEVDLPARMTSGTYTVELSRDSVSWIGLSGDARGPPQTFTVLNDPTLTPAIFPVGDPLYGIGSDFRFSHPGTPCLPDDGQDDTPCILNAIYAAQRASGGGTVVFGSGTWNVQNAMTTGTFSGVTGDGIEVPLHVHLQGTDPHETIVVRGASWPKLTPTFTLKGGNTVRGFTFRDESVYTSTDRAQAMLQVGQRWYWASSTPRPQVSGIVITGNVFDKPFYAIVSGHLPTDHLFVTQNVFGGVFQVAIALGGDNNDTVDRYELRDSVVAFNTFYPSSFIDTANGQGPIATHLSSGTRVDFSDNVADGSSAQYFYDPANDRKGFRAAFFWSVGTNQAMVLVAHNAALCSGDKVGDGESIVFDGDAGGEGFPIAQPVIYTTSWNDPDGVPGTSITVQGSVIETRTVYGVAQPIADLNDYYAGWWLRLVDGPGLGQWRKVHSLVTGFTEAGPTVTLNVTPAIDLPPDEAAGLALLGRGNWQLAVVDNFIDQRQPTCTKNNATKPQGGMLNLYSSTADSVIEGNQMFDTSGILLAHQYELPDFANNRPEFGTSIQSANEVRDNLIDGEYAWLEALSPSGIFLGYSATPNTAPPPVIGFGISIAHNTIDQADTASFVWPWASIGGIALGPSWHTGPLDANGMTPWQMGSSTLIFQNSLNDLNGGAPSRLGIGIDASFPLRPITWHTVLFANTCHNVQTAFQDNGTGTVRFCPAGMPPTCECSVVSSR